ncbi:MAG: NAD-dependent epimerase/dehydratase family protein [Planctomycetota bacterium]
MIKALVTGAGGFVGSHLTEALLRKGMRVCALVRNPDRLRWLKNIPDVEMRYGSLEDTASLEAAVQGVDLVFHAAGVVKTRQEDTYFRVNAQGTENLLNAVEKNAPGIRRFIYISSQAAAGPSRLDRAVREDELPHPLTPYGRSKLEGERHVLERKERLPVTLIRPPAVYGPRDSEIFIYFKIAAKGFIPIPGFGERRLSLVFIDDLVNGIVQASDSKAALGKIYFIKSGDYGWPELARALKEAVGRGFPVRVPAWTMMLAARASEAFGKYTGQAIALNRHKARELIQRAWLCSGERAEKELGFQPQWPLQKGMAVTAKWYYDAEWLRL